MRALMVALTMTLVGGGAAVGAVTPPPEVLRESLRAQMRERFTHEAGPLVAAYIQAHPDVYQAFETKVINDLLSDKLDAAATKAYAAEFSQNVRKQAGAATRLAPDEETVALAKAQLGVMRSAAQTNYRACYELHENHGLTADTAMTVGPMLMAELDKMTSAQAQAIVAGEKTPVTHAAPGQDDAVAVMRAFVASGGDRDWLKAMGASTTDTLTPADRCKGSIKWLEAIVAQPKAVAARMFLGS